MFLDWIKQKLGMWEQNTRTSGRQITCGDLGRVFGIDLVGPTPTVQVFNLNHKKPWAEPISKKQLFVFHYYSGSRYLEIEAFFWNILNVLCKHNVIITCQQLRYLFSYVKANYPWVNNGITVVINKNVEAGISVCSIKDTFSRKVGLETAYGRLSQTPLKLGGIR